MWCWRLGSMISRFHQQGQQKNPPGSGSGGVYLYLYAITNSGWFVSLSPDVQKVMLD